MRLVSVLLIALASCRDETSTFEPWPIPITGDLDAGRSLDAGLRDAAADATVARDAAQRDATSK